MKKARVLLGIDKAGIKVASIEEKCSNGGVDVRVTNYGDSEQVIKSGITKKLECINPKELDKVLLGLRMNKIFYNADEQTVFYKANEERYKYLLTSCNKDIPVFIVGTYTVFNKDKKIGRQVVVLSNTGKIAYLKEKNLYNLINSNPNFLSVAKSDMTNYYFSERGKGNFVVCKKPGVEFLFEKEIDVVEYMKIVSKKKNNFKEEVVDTENKSENNNKGTLEYTDAQLSAIIKAKNAGVEASKIKGKNFTAKQITLLTVAHKHKLPELEQLLSEAIVDEITSDMIFAEGVAGFDKELSILVKKYNEVRKLNNDITKDIAEASLSDTKVAAFIDVIESKNLNEEEIEKLANEIIYGSNMDAVNLANR